jgi:hypothetical protein
MSHPDPLFDPENSYEDDMEIYDENYNADGWYDECEDGDEQNEYEDAMYNEIMDGDHDSAMTSAGWGTDEDYGDYGSDNDFYYGDDF